MAEILISAMKKQVGGQHYVGMAIQPMQYIHANSLGYAEGAVVKYVSRWQRKGGIEDLRKARHFLDLLIELETAKQEAERERVMHSGPAFKHDKAEKTES